MRTAARTGPQAWLWRSSKSINSPDTYRRRHSRIVTSVSATLDGSASNDDTSVIDSHNTIGESEREAVESSSSNNTARIRTEPPRGTRDFPPEEYAVHSWLLQHMRAVAHQFGYEEWAAPVVEHEELYTRKQGEEIVSQLYAFEDKAGRRLALRPELTPSLARLVLQKGNSLPLPAKWFSIGQCWRYERMTRGRRREHYQWNMDVIGCASIDAEAELVASITTFLRRVGLTPADVGVRISSRKALAEVLHARGVPSERFGEVAIAVDKVDRCTEEEAQQELQSLALPDGTVTAILSATKARSVQELEQVLGASSEAVAELNEVLQALDAYGASDWVEVDISVVRGLAYYTGIVFEGFDRQGQFRALFGGGRYDKLLSTLGGSGTEDQPAVGFGFGDAVILELLQQKQLVPAAFQTASDLVVPLEDELKHYAARAATLLRQRGRSVDLVLQAKRLKWAFKRAERSNAERVVFIGKQEYDRGVVAIKHLASGEQVDVSLSELTSTTDDDMTAATLSAQHN